MFRCGWEAFKEKPLFGWGHDNYIVGCYANNNGSEVLRTNAHNDWLQVVSTLGGVGLGIYLVLNYYIWKECRKTRLTHAIFWGIFVILKVNPIGIQPLIVLALLLGARQIKAWNRGWALTALITLAILMSQRIHADFLYDESMKYRRLGMLSDSLRYAEPVMSLVSNEPNYRAKFFLDYAMLVEKADPVDQKGMLDSMDFLVEDGIKLHPNHPILKQMSRLNSELQGLRHPNPYNTGIIPGIIPTRQKVFGVSIGTYSSTRLQPSICGKSDGTKGRALPDPQSPGRWSCR